MEKTKKEFEPFSEFTNLYSLSKTLRFELKPMGNTLENMRKRAYVDKDGNKKDDYDAELQTFLRDQDIEDAYQTLKPVMDKIHETFITGSLKSEKAKEIDFSQYLEIYEKEKDELKKTEDNLRKQIGELFSETAKQFKDKYKNTDPKTGDIFDEIESNEDQGKKRKKGLFKKENYELLSESAILRYLEINLDTLAENETEKTKIKDALEKFKRFFTYFGGYNQNRENYYETKEEKATAVATRIVHENLPKFCDNVIQFEHIIKKKKNKETEEVEEEKISRKEEYKNTYKYLKDNGKTTQIKDAESGKMIEAVAISENIFKIDHFPSCLSQSDIEEYNRVIGHYNLLVNCYNQAKRSEEKDLEKNKKTFKDLPRFKTLWKQIGCGKKKDLFFTLTHDKKVDADKARREGKEAFSAEEVLFLADKASKKYFQGKSDEGAINTVPDFLEYILGKENYDDVYWSKTAMNTISDKYFANWHSLKDLLKDKKEVASFDKKREEQIKINDAVELSVFFDVLGATNDWQKPGVLFKESLTKEIKEGKDEEENKKRAERQKIIAEAKRPSEALLKMIFVDIKDNAKAFLDSADTVLGLKEYKSKESIETIKTWMDYALAVNRMLKYFLVKESKVKKTKGAPVDPAITEALNVLLRADDAEWFSWYDAIRNYLTKKPQDNAKENKLKLNFECPSLLGGWSDGQEKNKAAVLLKKDVFYYVGILKKKNLFDTEEKASSAVYKNPDSNSGRLILANLKFQTLAGKGFGVGEKSYGSIGKKDPMRAVVLLQKFIKDRYIKKYPLLKQIAESEYLDKKTFDKDIQETLRECYVCEFKPINWERAEEYSNKGELYLFQIYSKDIAKKSTGNKNMQTLYWDIVFNENSPFQLNGGGEIFYRKQAIKEKKIKNGYEKKPWVIENKRFTEEDGKFFFHCPIKINYKDKNYSNPKYALPETNKVINECLSKKDNLYFLGIDRGEKHLAYYSLVDQNGKIVDQGTLNLSFTDKDGKPRSIKKDKYFYDKKKKEWESEKVDCWDYNDLLDAMASNRDMARKNWQTIGTIKELKTGYVSQVVRKIADLATAGDKPAFIVLEDLNTGFKRGRQKIEKSVYQKLETALAKKLNFLVDKNAKHGEIGSVTNALQLTPPVNNYGDIENKKQVGIMLYTRANYTSQTDPLTGWRKTIYLKTGSEGSIKDQIIGNGKTGKDEIKPAFSDIRFDGKDYVFIYADKNTGKKWELYSGINGKNLDRFRGKRGEDKNEWKIEEMNVVKILDDVFAKFNKTKSLFEQMKEGAGLAKSNEHTAWESLRFAIELIQQIRNTGKEGDARNNDFILSPTRDKNGKHFDSREYWDKEQKKEKIYMPSSGDANGAFNIARKGALMNKHIRAWIESGQPKHDAKTSDLNLYISEPEWDLYLADKKAWEQQLPKFSSRKEMEEEKSKKSNHHLQSNNQTTHLTSRQ